MADEKRFWKYKLNKSIRPTEMGQYYPTLDGFTAECRALMKIFIYQKVSDFVNSKFYYYFIII